SYLIEAFVELAGAGSGVLIAHGDATSGYSLYIQDGRLVHDMNVGGEHVIVRSEVPVPAIGALRLGVRVRRLSHIENPTPATGPGTSEITLEIDGAIAGRVETKLGLPNFISWSGLDIGRDRGSPVSHYQAPFAFTGRLLRVEVTMDVDQRLDGDGIGAALMSRE
ncbi:MAG: arylsulfatase, partial [Reyranellaceae bacterium]